MRSWRRISSMIISWSSADGSSTNGHVVTYHVITLISRLARLVIYAENSRPAQNFFLSFLHSSLKESQSKLTKKQKRIYFSFLQIHFFFKKLYIEQKMLWEKVPGQHVFPPTSSPASCSHRYSFFFFILSPFLRKRKDEKRRGKWGGLEKGVRLGWKRRKRAAIKAIFAAYVSPPLAFFSIQSLRGLGRDR